MQAFSLILYTDFCTFALVLFVLVVIMCCVHKGWYLRQGFDVIVATGMLEACNNPYHGEAGFSQDMHQMWHSLVYG